MNRHTPIGIISIVAALLVLVPFFTRGWWSAEDKNEDGDVTGRTSVGVFSYERCREDWDSSEWECEEKDFSELVEDMEDRDADPEDEAAMDSFTTWLMFGKLAVAGALGTAVMLLVQGVFALQRRTRKLPMPALAGVALFGVVMMILWLAWNRASGESTIHPGYALFLALLGYGGVATVLWLRPGAVDAPGAFDLAAAAPAPYAMPGSAPIAAPPVAGPVLGHPCPRCGTPLTWAAPYSRWFCTSCQQYP